MVETGPTTPPPVDRKPLATSVLIMDAGAKLAIEIINPDATRHIAYVELPDVLSGANIIQAPPRSADGMAH